SSSAAASRYWSWARSRRGGGPVGRPSGRSNAWRRPRSGRRREWCPGRTPTGRSSACRPVAATVRARGPTGAPGGHRAVQRRGVQLLQLLARLIVDRGVCHHARSAVRAEPEVGVVEGERADMGVDELLALAAGADDLVAVPGLAELRGLRVQPVQQRL